MCRLLLSLLEEESSNSLKQSVFLFTYRIFFAVLEIYLSHSSFSSGKSHQQSAVLVRVGRLILCRAWRCCLGLISAKARLAVVEIEPEVEANLAAAWRWVWKVESCLLKQA